MAVPLIVATAVDGYTVSGSPSFTLSAPPAAGDFIYALVSVAAPPATQQAVAGWTNLIGADGTVLTTTDGTLVGVLMGHEVTGGEAGQTVWTLTSMFPVNESGITAAICLSGVDLTNVVDGFGSDEQAGTTVPFRLAATTVAAAGGVAATPTAEGLVIRWCVKDGVGSFTTPPGHTQRATGSVNSAVWLGTRDANASAGVDIASTDISPDVGDEFVSLTITSPGPASPGDTVNPVDPIGITDAVAIARDQIDERTDPVGLTDSITTLVVRGGVEDDPVGITDDIDVALDVLVDGPADGLGITDSVDVLVEGGPVDHDETPVDEVGITDSVQLSIEGEGEVSVAESVGITDAALVVLSSAEDTFISEFDSIGITDAVQLFLTGAGGPELTGARTLSDEAGTAGSCCGGRAIHRVSGDADDTLDLVLGGVEDLAGVLTVEAHVWRNHYPPTTLTATVVDPVARVIRVELSPWLDTAAPGRWNLDVKATWITGEALTFPASGYATLRVRSAAPV